jgi:hypothetical protein
VDSVERGGSVDAEARALGVLAAVGAAVLFGVGSLAIVGADSEAGR